MNKSHYFEYKGERYLVDGKKVVLDYSEEERRVAEWLENTFGGEIYLLPRINDPEGIKTPDYLWNHEYWDLKTINGNSKQALYHAVRKKEKQSNNFIFEIKKSNLSMKEINSQIDELYKRTDMPFVEKIMIKKKNVTAP